MAMGSVVAHNRFGPDTYKVSAEVQGGELVHPTTGGEIGPVDLDGATDVLGVALYTAVPAGTSKSGTMSYGAESYDHSQPSHRVAVAWQGTFKLLHDTDGADALVFGEPVVAANAGDVRGYDSVGGDTPDQIIGKVVETGGIAAGEKGLVRLSL